MTTCAWFGNQAAADTLGEQNCLRMYNSKIYHNDRVVLMGAGIRHQIMNHWKAIKDMELAGILDFGFPNYQPGECDPGMILVSRQHTQHNAWYLTGSVWTKINRPYHAIGSGRDFALAAMRLGKSPREAVELSAEFDVYTGGEIEVVEI